MISDTTQVSDSLAAAAQSSGEDTSWIMHHILDSKYILGIFPSPEIHLFGIDLTITNHVFFMWIAVAILFFVLRKVANSYKQSLTPKGVSNFMEVLILFVRDEIVKPTIGHGYERFLPYLLTVFFFILTCNFLGLVPGGATATSNISVTVTLAVISFIVTQAGGIMKNGFFGYFKGLIPSGVPGWLFPIMGIVEFLGLLTKPFALAVRLFANLTAGHIVIYALIGLIFILKTYYVAPVSVAFALFIYLLEILVALIQAYIFTMLSSLFIGMAVHQDH
jgi:F-type H+-transporting ATPase subunit a